MNDYLTRIAQLCRGEATIVSPRVPSLFVSSVDVGFSGITETTSQPQGKPVTSPNTAQAAVKSPEDKETPRLDRPTEPPADTQPISEEKVLKAVNATMPALEPLFQPHRLQRDNSKETVSIQHRASAAHEHKPSALLADKLQTPVASNEDNDSDAPSEPNEPPTTLLPQSSMPLVPNFQSQLATPLQRIVDLTHTVEETVTQEPTVHIKIGRVEVRAQTAAPTPAPRSAPLKPEKRFSLDEYLQRGGGRS